MKHLRRADVDAFCNKGAIYVKVFANCDYLRTFAHHFADNGQ